MEITQSQIKKRLAADYINAGDNAYFGNGFNAGVKFAQENLLKSQQYGMIKFWYACNNISLYSILPKCFKDDDELTHLEGIAESSEWNLFSFMEYIDERQRGIILDYIAKKYDGIEYSVFEAKYTSK